MSAHPSSKCLLHCVCCGVSFRILAQAPSQLQVAESILPHLTEVVEGTPEGAHTFVLQPGSDLAQVRADVMIHVANYAPDLLFVHAGVVGWQGAAMLFPGPSFAGKSTLVAELVKAGATYYSDEYAVIDEQGLVHPFARALQMREIGGREQRSVALAELQSVQKAVAGAVPLPVSCVIFTRFHAGASWNPRHVSPANAILEMLRHTIAVQRTPMRAMKVLQTMMNAGATTVRSLRGDAPETARKLLGGEVHGTVGDPPISRSRIGNNSRDRHL